MSGTAPLAAIRRWNHATAVFRISGASSPDGPWPARVVMNGRRLIVEVRWQNRVISYSGALDTTGAYQLQIDEPPGGRAELEPDDLNEPGKLEGGWNEGGGNRGTWTVHLGQLV